jgi:hypothetical protein
MLEMKRQTPVRAVALQFVMIANHIVGHYIAILRRAARRLPRCVSRKKTSSFRRQSTAVETHTRLNCADSTWRRAHRRRTAPGNPDK